VLNNLRKQKLETKTKRSKNKQEARSNRLETMYQMWKSSLSTYVTYQNEGVCYKERGGLVLNSLRKQKV